jgi:type I restriction enzyme M protein
LLNAASYFTPLKKSLGSKRKEINHNQRDELVKLYTAYKESDDCKIYDNNYFGYTKVTVERPLLDELGDPQKKKDGSFKPDGKKRDTERIPLQTDVQTYFDKEVAPHVSDAWMDRAKDKIGYEINFTKYFYKYKPLRPLAEISKELAELDKTTIDLMKKLSL